MRGGAIICRLASCQASAAWHEGRAHRPEAYLFVKAEELVQLADVRSLENEDFSCAAVVRRLRGGAGENWAKVRILSPVLFKNIKGFA